MIAEAIGRAFDLPVDSIAAEEVFDHFGWIGGFFGMDLATSSAVTRTARLGADGPDAHRRHRCGRLPRVTSSTAAEGD